jgi:antirestriction protein ArdC
MAEIGSCYLASELGIPTADTSVNHQSYIASWLRGLQNDHRFIFQASSQASKAADYILSFSRQPVAEEEPAMA